MWSHPFALSTPGNLAEFTSYVIVTFGSGASEDSARLVGSKGTDVDFA
jgi:hypothetical protein